MTRPFYFECGGDLFVNGSPPLPMTDEDYLAELDRLNDEIAAGNASPVPLAGLDAARRAADLTSAFGLLNQRREMFAKIRKTA